MSKLNKLSVAELMKALNVSEEVAQQIVNLQTEARPFTRKYVIDLTDEQLAEVKATFPELEIERKTTYKPKKKAEAQPAETKPVKGKSQGELSI